MPFYRENTIDRIHNESTSGFFSSSVELASTLRLAAIFIAMLLVAFIVSGGVEKAYKYLVSRLSNLSKGWRLAIFGTLAWILAVPIFVLLFEPYGRRMYDADVEHMLLVMFVPSVLGLVLYWIYERFVR